MKDTWTEYKVSPTDILYMGADRFWQKKLSFKGSTIYLSDPSIEVESEVYIQLVEYSPVGDIKAYSWQLDFQIHDSISITGKTINVTHFRYDEKNLAQAENDALKIIKGLIK